MISSKAEASGHGKKWWLYGGLLAVLFAALVAYVVSYYVISRRGMAEAAAYDMNGFYYVSVDQIVSDSIAVQKMHGRRLLVYAPLNWIDRTFLGGMPACWSWPLMKLSDTGKLKEDRSALSTSSEVIT